MRKITLPVRGPRMAIVVGPHLFVTSYADNQVVRMPWPACDGVDGTVRMWRPRGIVHCKGVLYVACYGNPMGRVVALDPMRMTTRHVCWAFRPRGIGLWRDMILVTEVNRSRVAAYDTDGRRLRVWTGFSEPRDLCVRGDDMWVADTGNHRVVRVRLDTCSKQVVAKLHRPNGVATDGTVVLISQWKRGAVVVACADGRILRVVKAHTPAMASPIARGFLICDAVDHCVYVVSR